eukprot:sb/3477664/
MGRSIQQDILKLWPDYTVCELPERMVQDLRPPTDQKQLVSDVVKKVVEFIRDRKQVEGVQVPDNVIIGKLMGKLLSEECQHFARLVEKGDSSAMRRFVEITMRDTH